MAEKKVSPILDDRPAEVDALGFALPRHSGGDRGRPRHPHPADHRHFRHLGRGQDQPDEHGQGPH